MTGSHYPLLKGIPPPTSNVTYTPNQFFDVVLPHSSRGVVRLVAYIIRKQLGWCDAHGNPQEPQTLIAYAELEKNVGIAHGALRRALDEAVAAHYLVCVREGRPNTRGQRATSALYELRWDETGEYHNNPKKFRGFYAGEGHRTNIPNVFFDVIIRSEPLAVIKAFGAIIRYTIGFQTKYGFRRQEVQMSLSTLEKHTHLSRRALCLALDQAINHNYVVRLKEGFFDPQAGKRSEATTYGIKWLDQITSAPNTPKSIPGNQAAEHSKKYTGNTPKSSPAEHSKKYTHINNTLEIKPLQMKQQQAVTEDVTPAVVAESETQSLQLLLQQGFARKVALQLAAEHPAEQIQNQILWLSKRNVTRNRLGFLRRAIEENWPEPETLEQTQDTTGIANTKGRVFAAYFYAGRAGNQEAPIAVPSTKDIQMADEFISRLLSVSPDESRIPEWGRQLGQLAREADRFNEKAIVSFVLALRNHGDRLFNEVKTETDRERKRKEAQEEAEYFNQQYPHYLTYLRAEEEQYRALFPDHYSKWLAQFDTFRFTVQEGEESRLKAFCHARNLLDFWDWDQRVNTKNQAVKSHQL